MRPYATGCQKGAVRVGPFFAPRTRLGIALRNLFYGALTAPPSLWAFERLVKSTASDLSLPEYAI